MPFTTLGLSDVLSQPLARLGYAHPTRVQSESIPVALAGRDMIARAQTGTGKTAAFALPMIDRLLVRNRRSSIARAARGLVLVPTRELAAQVHRAFISYGAPVTPRVAMIIGGVAMRPQIEALRRGVDIVVATPGRLIDHMEQGTIDLSRVEIVTLDEADRLLDMGFRPALRRVMTATPAARQTLLLSATISSDVAQLTSAFTRDAQRVDVANGNVVAATVVHGVQTVGHDDKSDALTRVLAQSPAGQALVFCRTKRRSDRVGEHLVRAGFRAAVIHGNKSQGARARALGDF